ncbi:LemA family protein [filamentous cyanobacterium LEGE 11480]|uniref:LemA family protein n=1 Tax=Romeriopsis navalis LEGE 11480 TaxID=2777977 RepID=A0A928VMV3_9CYAN|nr:LemA family protein [Romeriopsis navalis]MBE9031461.1 LemA family protein [Romeriopsis navalis LEGE 11480]
MVIFSLIFVLAVIGLVIFVLVSAYNDLVAGRNRYKNAFAQIDVQLQRRYDLIPNLIETAKGYMKHERETLEAVIAARNSAISASSAAASNPGDAQAMQQLGTAEAALTGTLSRFMALSESYPDLKADATMTRVMEELSSTENKVAFARQGFNDAVTNYNTKREIFPNNLVAGGFAAAELLEEVSAEVRQAPRVSFS